MKAHKIKKNYGKNRIWSVSITAAFLASAVIFGVMLKIEQNALKQYEKGSIFIASAKIPRGQRITAENYTDFFEEREIDKSCIPKTALQSPEQVTHLASVFDIEQGVLLTSGMFEELDKIKDSMNQPVIAGVKAEDLHQLASGVLRAGDRIHIYTIREEGNVAPVWKDAYVEQAFDASGNVIAVEDKITAAQRINIYLEAEAVEEFYAELAAGSLRAVKVCN